METETLITMWIVSFIVGLLLLHWVIASATQTKTMRSYQEKEIRLLMLACEKLGATKEEVNKALNG